ncbi:transglutaminase-like domain-containing protein [Thermococcus sp. LS2]|uniref:transglutaminase-like domain-containing protein n=1 Tax=Thermococcus sp. LS2 TaxID=1638260 RepID=UPI001439B424|nr:transglutaminase-like domain-containing protein [Thermococcus sp. LS2]NJE13678.1 hypothetical protein [Thermococcus sp. LS2]
MGIAKVIVKLFLIMLIIFGLVYDYKTSALSQRIGEYLEITGITTIDKDYYLKTYGKYFDCSPPYWKQWGPGIIKCDIGPDEIQRIMPVAERVKGKDIMETAWNLHYWLMNNTEYDYDKYMSLEEGTLLPHEFLEKRTGVCRDYAVFNYAIMKALGYRDIYLGHVSLSSTIFGHTVLVFKYKGQYYVLDWWGPQKLDENYARKWRGSLGIVILNDEGKIVDYVGVTQSQMLNNSPKIVLLIVSLLLIGVILKL